MNSTRPALVNADDEDSSNNNKEGVARNMHMNIDRKAIAFLLRYETMVRQQEAEEMATLAHVRPFLGNIDDAKMEEDVDLEREVPFAQLKSALELLQDEDTESYMQSDRQLVMVLQTLTSKPCPGGSITWAEFLQCYKTIISGMQTLQHVTEPHLRARCKDRTLSMISLFEPPATRLLGESVEFPTKKANVALDKRAVHVVMGAIVGAALTSTGMSLAKTSIPATATTVIPPPQECKKVVTIKEKTPVLSPSTITTFDAKPPFLERNTQGLEARQQLAIPPKSIPRKTRSSSASKLNTIKRTKTSRITTPPPQVSTPAPFSRTLTAAAGGATSVIVAPVVWSALQQIPTALAGLSVGGWGVVSFATAVVINGLFHSVTSMLRSVQRKRRKTSRSKRRTK